MVIKSGKPKISLSWLYVIIGGVLLYIYMFGENSNDQIIRKTYSEVEDYIRNGYVEDIKVINNSRLEAYIKSDSAKKVAEQLPANGARLKVESTI